MKKYRVQDDVRLPTRPRCLNCATLLDGATAVDESEPRKHYPKDGDVTVCITCGHIMMYTADNMLREPTNEEIHALAGDPRILMIMKGRAAYERAKALSGGHPGSDPGDGAPGSKEAGPPGTNGKREDKGSS